MSLKPIKKIYLVRHGETEYNRMNIVQGSSVDIDINEKGKLQASLFYETYKNVPFDKVYTSVLKRSFQSVNQFISDGTPHKKLEELNEICWGELEGQMQSEEQKNRFWEVVSKWNNGDFEARITNGESPTEMQLRQKNALEIILKNEHEKTILICMHGRAMKSFLCLLLDISLTKMEEFQHTNLGLYVLHFDGNKFDLILRNDISHLNV